MKNLSKILGGLFFASILFNPLINYSIKSESLKEKYNSQSSASWENSNYWGDGIGNVVNGRGEKWTFRYFIDNNSNIYRFGRTTSMGITGPEKIGNLNSQKTSSYYPYNVTEFSIEDCSLVEYSEANGKIDRYLLAKGKNC